MESGAAKLKDKASQREQRRDVRYKLRVPATIIEGKRSTEVFTEDVSFRGAFLRTAEPPKLRQLLQIKFHLPGGDSITLHGMAVHGEPAGVGVQFYALDERVRMRWERFIADVRSKRLPQAGGIGRLNTVPRGG